LLLTDRIDEWMLSHVRGFEGKELVSIAKGGLDLGGLADEEEQKQQESVAEQFKPLVERLNHALGERVKEVRVTFRLVDSPACVVSDDQDMSAHLQRLLKAAGQDAPELKPILEINPDQALVNRLQELEEERFADWAEVLLVQALLAEGVTLADPAAYVQRINQLLLAPRRANPAAALHGRSRKA